MFRRECFSDALYFGKGGSEEQSATFRIGSFVGSTPLFAQAVLGTQSYH